MFDGQERREADAAVKFGGAASSYSRGLAKMPPPYIHIRDAIMFTGNHEVFVNRNALNLTADDLKEAIELAFLHCRDDLLVSAACGAVGPFARYSDLGLDEYLALKEEFETDILRADATRIAKQRHTTIRREEFNRIRSDLYLAMIDSGITHECFEGTCSEREILTIDHIIPLSRGGTDQLTNLRFACRRHNSAKGDRPDKEP